MQQNRDAVTRDDVTAQHHDTRDARKQRRDVRDAAARRPDETTPRRRDMRRRDAATSRSRGARNTHATRRPADTTLRRRDDLTL
jgi:hypothetical protein